jgi:hypothetical protein
MADDNPVHEATRTRATTATSWVTRRRSASVAPQSPAGAIVVVPSDVIRPSLAERLRGMAADRLGSVIGLPTVVAAEA